MRWCWGITRGGWWGGINITRRANCGYRGARRRSGFCRWGWPVCWRGRWCGRCGGCAGVIRWRWDRKARGEVVGDTLVCPKCRERLWVGEMQIPLVTCPKCLARVVNPNAREDAAAAALLEYRIPRRWVVPVEEESDADIRNTAMWLAILAVGLFAGAILVAIVVGLNFMSLLMVGGGLFMAIAVGWMNLKAPKAEVAERPFVERVQRGGATVFDYASPGKQGGTGQFFGGFVVAIGVSFITLIGTGIGKGTGG